MKKKSKKLDKINKKNSYPNPTIAEALCEIHFYSKADYDNCKLDVLKNVLKIDYPNVTEQKIKQYRAAINESGISVEEEKLGANRWIFKHKDRNHLLQIHPGTLTINQVGMYPGWDKFKEDIFEGWTAINHAFPVVVIKRIGLRYINLIPRVVKEPLSEWLTINQYYPNAILDNIDSFFSRSEFKLKENKRLIVSISEPLEPNGRVIFDLDVISAVEEENNISSLSAMLDGLHDKLSEVFFSSLTKKYEAYLEEKNDSPKKSNKF